MADNHAMYLQFSSCYVAKSNRKVPFTCYNEQDDYETHMENFYMMQNSVLIYFYKTHFIIIPISYINYT